jgi:hypothetical protein
MQILSAFTMLFCGVSQFNLFRFKLYNLDGIEIFLASYSHLSKCNFLGVRIFRHGFVGFT